MRLIDADALEQKRMYIDDYPAVLELDIDNAPTIDAISVEWLKEHVDGEIRDSDGNSYGRKRITVVEALSMWQNEQEAQNEHDRMGEA